MTVQSWSPARFLADADHLDTWNRLIGFAGTKLPLAVDKAFMTAELVDPPVAGTGLTAVTSGSLDGLARFEAFPFKALFGIDLAADDVGNLAAPLRDALMDGMIQFVARALPAPYGEWRQRPSQSGLVAEDLQWSRFVLQGLAAEPVQFILGLARDKLVAAVVEGVRNGQPLARGVMAATPVRPAVTLLRASISKSALDRIAVGSFLLLPENRPGLTLRLEDQNWHFNQDPGGWIVTGSGPVDAIRLDSDMEGMSDVSNADGGRDAGLRLPVDFDIGRVQVSIADIDSWKPGTVVALDAPVTADGLEVTISINGTTIGSGELVKVEDRFAIRITRLAAT